MEHICKNCAYLLQDFATLVCGKMLLTTYFDSTCRFWEECEKSVD